MTGPEHYSEAERLLAAALTSPDLPGQVEEWITYRESDIAAAQVHATLALAAATIDVAGATNNGVVSAGWGEVLS